MRYVRTHRSNWKEVENHFTFLNDICKNQMKAANRTEKVVVKIPK